MYLRKGSLAAGLVMVVVGAGTASAQFKKIGYMPSWAGSVSSVQYQYLTHVNYAFALPNSNGTLKPIENASKLSSLVSSAHSKNVKVLLSIGGWNDGNDSAFETLAASSTGRTTFVNTCVSTLNQYGLDGIDIDWEYPDPGASATNYQNLMNQLCSAMHSRGKLCSAAVVAQGSTGGGVTSAVFGYVDYLQIMAYDASDGDHSSRAYADSSLSYWLNRGLPQSKAVLGVPFYARPSWAAYNTLLAAGCSSTADTCTYQGVKNYYNGTTTIAWKRDLAMSRGGGIMNWELSQDVNDSRSLLRAMAGSGTTPTATPTARPTATPTPGGAVKLAVSSATASTNDGNVPANAIDGNLATRWSASGDGPWLQLDLGSTKTVMSIKLAWYNGNVRTSTFDVLVSGSSSGPWTTLLSRAQSNGSSTALQIHDLADTSARYVRVVGHGNSVNLWNSVTEAEVWGR